MEHKLAPHSLTFENPFRLPQNASIFALSMPTLQIIPPVDEDALNRKKIIILGKSSNPDPDALF